MRSKAYTNYDVNVIRKEGKNMSSNSHLKILNSKPEPKPELKVFHKEKMLGWSGSVNIGKIHGWAENRRIALFKHKCEMQFGRTPTDDEIYKFMLSEPEFHIRELARSIFYNGVKVPIILDSDGTLLDGNRRYVATRRAIENNPDAKDELENMPAWVLGEDATALDKQKILVECNFVDDWRVKWPPYIKAATVYEDYVDRGTDYDVLTERYDLTKTQLRTIVKVMGIIEEFMNFHNNSDESIRVAYEYYHFFEEAHNKFRSKLDSDPDFKEQFFTWMLQGKFAQMKQVTKLGEVRDNEEAWDRIRKDDPDAVKAAIYIVDGEKLQGGLDGEKKIKRAIKLLRELKEHEIASMSKKTLQELQGTLTEVVRMAQSVLLPGSKFHIPIKDSEAQDESA